MVLFVLYFYSKKMQHSIVSLSSPCCHHILYLGPPTKLEVIRTEREGYLIRATLSQPLPVPVRVDVWFSDPFSNTEERSLEPEYFYNTTRLTALRNYVPFRRFRVHVRILFGDDITAGVFMNRSTIYGKFARGNVHYS